MAPCTMNTLFWAGSVFAQHVCLLRDTHGRPLRPDSAMNIQVFLQEAYVEAYAQLIEALSPLPALTGFEVRTLYS